MRFFTAILVVSGAAAQDWDALKALKPDTPLRISLRAGRPLEGSFAGFSPDSVTVAASTISRAEVKRIEAVRPQPRGRWKRAGLAAVIGGGAGFVIGASVGGCRVGSFFCISRGAAGTAAGALGAVGGFVAFTAAPPRLRYTIYRSR